MFCPQCGLESQADLKFCRSCGANLKVIGKAVTLSEAIARSDGVPAKIKEMVQNLKVEKVTEEVSRAMDKMNREIQESAARQHKTRRERRRRKQKTPAERRESLLIRGWTKLGGGAGFTLFLYFLSHSIALKLNPADVAKVPFDIDSVVRVIWLVGLIPLLSGLGRVIAGLSIKTTATREVEGPEEMPLRIDSPPAELHPPVAPQPFTSVTERTTNILDREPVRRAAE